MRKNQQQLSGPDTDMQSVPELGIRPVADAVFFVRG
jgi:hypothetical protein